MSKQTTAQNVKVGDALVFDTAASTLEKRPDASPTYTRYVTSVTPNDDGELVIKSTSIGVLRGRTKPTARLNRTIIAAPNAKVGRNTAGRKLGIKVDPDDRRGHEVGEVKVTRDPSIVKSAESDAATAAPTNDRAALIADLKTAGYSVAEVLDALG